MNGKVNILPLPSLAMKQIERPTSNLVRVIAIIRTVLAKREPENRIDVAEYRNSIPMNHHMHQVR